MLIECSKLESGKIEFGTLVETGIKSLKGKKVKVDVDGVSYTAVIE